jgi:hypothetical protein
VCYAGASRLREIDCSSNLYAVAGTRPEFCARVAFAERILPRASDLWVQASLDYKQRLQQLFFPEGIAFNGNRFNRTAATAPLFNYLAPSESAVEKMVSGTGIEPESKLPQQSAASRGLLLSIGPGAYHTANAIRSRLV